MQRQFAPLYPEDDVAPSGSNVISLDSRRNELSVEQRLEINAKSLELAATSSKTNFYWGVFFPRKIGKNEWDFSFLDAAAWDYMNHKKLIGDLPRSSSAYWMHVNDADKNVLRDVVVTTGLAAVAAITGINMVNLALHVPHNWAVDTCAAFSTTFCALPTIIRSMTRSMNSNHAWRTKCMRDAELEI